MTDMVFRFPAPGPDPMLTDLEGWIKVAGHPTMKTWVQHTTIDGSVISGTWEATPGTWHTTYKFYEFVHLIEGQITITPDGGTPVTMHPGDGFAVEAGFTGTWTIDKPVRKHFCIKLK
jgi:uncharacterized cupin superfamily protein